MGISPDIRLNGHSAHIDSPCVLSVDDVRYLYYVMLGQAPPAGRLIDELNAVNLQSWYEVDFPEDILKIECAEAKKMLRGIIEYANEVLERKESRIRFNNI